MRVHIYDEELGEGVELVPKDNVNGNETFYGLRVWLKSPQETSTIPPKTTTTVAPSPSSRQGDAARHDLADGGRA